jgi:hypothetical protein
MNVLESHGDGALRRIATTPKVERYRWVILLDRFGSALLSLMCTHPLTRNGDLLRSMAHTVHLQSSQAQQN